MFNNQNIGERGVSRPFIVGLILLILFLTTSQDWGSASSHQSSSPTSNRSNMKSFTPSKQISEEVKEKIIKDLTINNEMLENRLEKLTHSFIAMRQAYHAFEHGKNGTYVLESLNMLHLIDSLDAGGLLEGFDGNSNVTQLENHSLEEENAITKNNSVLVENSKI